MTVWHVRPLRPWLSFCAAIAVGCANAGTATAADNPLTKSELETLFQGKSWIWEEGSGFFAPGGRFWAVGGTGKSRSKVNGFWVAADDGKLCFSGTWRLSGKSRGRFERSCFSHKKTDGTIFQKREPKGDWYAFMHDPPQPTDQKLESGDKTGAAPD